MEQRYTFDISTGALLRILVVIVFIVLFLLLWKVLAGVFLAIILAATIEPVILFMRKAHIPRFATVILVYLVGIAILGGMLYLVLPNLFFEFRDLSNTLPERYSGLAQSLHQRLPLISLPDIGEGGLGQIFQNFRSESGVAASDLFSFAFSFFGGVLSVILIFVISFYLSLEERGMEKFLGSLVPTRHKEYVFDLWRRVQQKLSRWMQSQIILILFVGLTMFPILWGIGVEYALTFAIVVSLLEIIPVIGPILGTVILFLLILLQSPMLALVAVGAYVLIQQVQANFIIPAVVSRAIGLNPVVIILLLIAGGALAGVWGAILAIPLGAVAAEFLRDIKDIRSVGQQSELG